MIRVVVVDDEPLAREGLRLLLAEEADVTVIAEASNGREALAVVQQHLPDVVFLDIQMPRLNGLDVIDALPPAQRPLFVFLTAHAEHAVTAFRLDALDYLLKPIDEKLLGAALARARTALAKRAGDAVNQAARLAFRVDGIVHLLAPAEIHYVEAAGDYLMLHTDEGQLLIRETLTTLATQLTPHGFMRVHRSALVNLQQVRELDLRDADEPQLVLQSGRRVRVSRGQRDAVERNLIKPQTSRR